jgi:hypothetical protein
MEQQAKSKNCGEASAIILSGYFMRKEKIKE